MRKYWIIFSLGLRNALEYRGALITWILVELMTLTSAIFIWTAIYHSNTQIGSYSYKQIMAYYFLIPLVGAITSAHLSERLPRRIKDGDITKDLLKPYTFLLGFTINQFAIKLIQNTLKIPVYLLIGLILYIKFQFSLNLTHLFFGLTMALFCFLLHCLLDITLSLFAFWFDDSWSLSLIKQVALMIFGGLSFPIDLIPHQWKTLYTLLPFDLIYYFPVSLILGKLNNFLIITYIFKLIIWSLISFTLVKYLWQKGVKKYSAYGQ